MSIATVAALIGSGVSGCVPVIGTLTLNDLMTGASLATTALTGKSLSDHALSAATGEDCSLMDAVFEEDRHICEVPGSKVTQNEFKGLIGMSQSSAAQPQSTADTPVAADNETDTGADAITASDDASAPRGVSLALAAQANSTSTSAAGNAGSTSDAGTNPTIDLNLVNILTGSGDNTDGAR